MTSTPIPPDRVVTASGYRIPAAGLDTTGQRDLRKLVLDPGGRLRVLPAEFWETTTAVERGMLGARTGSYVLPTMQLVDRLRELIGGRTAIEIGAGNGVLAEALGIIGTDSHQQDIPKYRRVYEQLGQAPVPYGRDVVNVTAATAVRTYRPQVVIGAWVTHRFDPARPDLRGNEVGVDEADIIDICETYILIGNTNVHRGKPIWALPHTIEYPPYLFSRATSGGREFIAVWNRPKPTEAQS
jgi:hypothetical protein